MNLLAVVKVILRPRAGAEVGSCIQEAIQFATQEWRDVEFTHNATRYQVRVDDLYRLVVETEERT